MADSKGSSGSGTRGQETMTNPSTSGGSRQASASPKVKSTENDYANYISADEDVADTTKTTVDDKDNQEINVSYEDLPISVQRRIRALRKNQVSILTKECEFEKELFELELRYQKKFEPIYQLRKAIINGEHEPTDEECDFKVGYEIIPPENSNSNPSEPDDCIIGVPYFWLTIFQSFHGLSQVIDEWDIPILRHLSDIHMNNSTNPFGFTLEFHFSENEFFTNSVLTKHYTVKYELDRINPLTFDGPEIVDCKGCEITWHPEKDITKKITDKKQKHKRTGIVRVIQKVEKLPSFFNFFSPPDLHDPNHTDEDVEILNMDFELGQYLRQYIIPRAVLYFTGEAGDCHDDFSGSSTTDTEAVSDDATGYEVVDDDAGDNHQDNNV